MRIEYEPKHDIMNVEFLENVDIEESIEYDGIIIDYAKDRRIVSIEILDVGKRITKKPLETINFAIIKEKV
ncbi:MAG: DUF2283 domain-containing protein [Euryarchaeota archaeon CG01_land_8_20_14_3_00_38_12]|nr:MAG: DUF2283 domain-containing protein [Euryarchaeota archaeon CG01_land_8_20_14_3_00_38_12]PJB21872.1 MAG: DUF2283 domain-containing protein [Euryarchaeota archaeon CG_4_9_14_3_um_filter_38_12]